MEQQAGEPLEVLREIWSATGQSDADLADQFGPAKSCKRMKDVSFDAPSGDDGDLRARWRSRLARDGKLDPASPGILDLIAVPPAPPRASR